MDFHPRLLSIEVPEKRATKWFKELLSAVDYLHTKGITHNDIKPSNILLSSDDSAVLCDFGFARQNKPAKDTGDAQVIIPPFHSKLSYGTPEYLAPERAKAQMHDERLSDIWSLGVTLYEVVVGRRAS
jgi:serine/threonine-protein kinase GIN4